MLRNLRATVWDTAIVLVCGALLFTVLFGVADRQSSAELRDAPCILIDPGHGGADGGATAGDGTEEKELNLKIAAPLRDMLCVMGYRVVSTRTDDSMICTEGSTLRERKVSDMRNRLAMINAAELTVSIHQNKFSQAQYWGTQVFYSANTAESKLLAESIRACVVEWLQPTNTRELKRGTEEVYLLHRAERPMVLVECGFLSNAEELERLKKEDYRQTLAFAVAVGTMKYIG